MRSDKACVTKTPQGLCLTIGDQHHVIRVANFEHKPWLDFFEGILAASQSAPSEHMLRVGDVPAIYLKAVRHDNSLELQVCDRALGHLGHPAQTTVSQFGRLWAEIVQFASPGRLPQRLQRLYRWSQALETPPALPKSLPPAAVERIAASPDENREPPWPIDHLHHIAYHPVWTDELNTPLASRICGSHIFIETRDGVRVRDVHDGAILLELPGHTMADTGTGGFTINPSRELVYFDKDVSVRWQTPLDYETPARWVHSIGSTAIVGNDEGRIDAFQLEDGRRLWSYEVFRGPPSEPLVTHNHLWIRGDDGFIHQLNAETGHAVAYHRMDGHSSELQVTNEHYYLIVNETIGQGHSSIRCFNEKDTDLAWERALTGRATALVGTDDHKLHCLVEGERELRIVTLSIQYGHVLSDRTTGIRTTFAQIYALKGLLLIKCLNGYVLALEEASGQPLWAIEPDDTDNSATAIGPPVFLRGLILSPGASLRAIHPKNGEILQVIHNASLHPKDLMVVDDAQLIAWDGQIVTSYRLGGHLASVPSLD